MPSLPIAAGREFYLSGAHDGVVAIGSGAHGGKAILLPAVLRFNAPAIEGKPTLMAAAMRLPDPLFSTCPGAVSGLLDRMEIPRDLAEIGAPADEALSEGR